ncbi:secreted/surface protein with fasciclin-like repeats [Belliella baltica DSM 15883]|uniref:Secreted/surface protein with fasciclin-like repeats n=1 Tax=Belliella baltica (strain DSM 15883 / CIP 108006 / LMG 21964 / BA134) TaxID=866536 RepID=I3Z8J9_BELBD|nr:fasciclin domain-containing protein [Belliella baltica]AFL85567.1 secreted/surface protein with fasciclin-like repeats [Belliella baltica DSM 15883]
MKKNLSTRFKTKMSVIFTALVLLAVSFSCTSIEEQPTLDENAMFKKAFLEELENLNFTSNPNARNGKVPSLQVTLAALRMTDNWVPAVKDRATVFMATDEAYAEINITTKNLAENIDLVMAAIGNQVISAKKFSGNQLESIQDEPNLLSMLTRAPTSLTVSNSGDQLILTDTFNQSANIIGTDFKATNSVTHFIDKVLIPQLPPPPSE